MRRDTRIHRTYRHGARETLEELRERIAYLDRIAEQLEQARKLADEIHEIIERNE